MTEANLTADLSSWSGPTILNTHHGPIEYIEPGEGVVEHDDRPDENYKLIF